MSIVRADKSEYSKVDWIPTGISALDSKLGGGIPTKRITEVFGPYSVGKTTLALTIVAEAQELGYKTLWSDNEWAWEPNYAETLGVSLDKLDLLQEREAETALNALVEWVEKNKDALVVIDAIGALQPRIEAEKAIGEKVIGGQASLIARFCRQIVPILAMNNVALLVLNHQFTDLMTGALKTSGGAKLEYHKSVSLSLKRAYGKTAKRNTDGKIFEIVIEAEVRKNKLAGTLGSKIELFMNPGEGFLKQGNLTQEAIDAGLFEKRGNTFFFEETKIGTMKKLREYVKENAEAIKEKLK